MKNKLKLLVIACLLGIIIPVNTISAYGNISESYQWNSHRASNTQGVAYTISSNRQTYVYIELRSYAYNGKTFETKGTANSAYALAGANTYHTAGYKISQIYSIHAWANRNTEVLNLKYN